MVLRAGDREPESRRMSSNWSPEQGTQHESMREGEELTTCLIEGSPDCLKVLDLDGRLLSMNARGMKALEICDLAPVLNSSWIDFWQGEDCENARKAVVTARNGSIGRFTGFFATTQTQTPKWWDVIVSPIFFFSSRRRHTMLTCDWSSDVCSSD